MNALPVEDEFFHAIEGNDAYNEAIEAQWQAVLTLCRFGVLHEACQAMMPSPLFGSLPQTWGNFGLLFPPVFASSLRPRWDAQPVYVLSLSFAMRIKSVELLIDWVAGGWLRPGVEELAA